MLASANNPNLTVVKIDVLGNWMIPSVQLAATDKVAAALSQVDNKNSAIYQNSAAEYKDRIVAKEAEIKAKLAQVNLTAVKVISADFQVPIVKWTGLNVIATYASPESLTKRRREYLYKRVLPWKDSL